MKEQSLLKIRVNTHVHNLQREEGFLPKSGLSNQTRAQTYKGDVWVWFINLSDVFFIDRFLRVNIITDVLPS